MWYIHRYIGMFVWWEILTLKLQKIRFKRLYHLIKKRTNDTIRFPWRQRLDSNLEQDEWKTKYSHFNMIIENRIRNFDPNSRPLYPHLGHVLTAQPTFYLSYMNALYTKTVDKSLRYYFKKWCSAYPFYFTSLFFPFFSTQLHL